MSTTVRDIPRQPPPKREVETKHRPIEQEIENLKRLLAHISQRLDKLKTS